MGLLEILAFKSSCMYLSDLRFHKNLPSVQHALQEIDPECYCLREWNDAVQYLTGENMNFSTREEALNYLLADKQSHKKELNQNEEDRHHQADKA